MHLHTDTNAALVVEGTAHALRRGVTPAIVWLPVTGQRFAVYLCDRSADLYTAHAHVGNVADEATGFRRYGPTWAGMDAGAEFRRFTQRVTHGGSRIILPNGDTVRAA